MKASPLLLILCLSVAPAHAGGRFGGPHGGFKNFVNAVSDIEPGPAPAPPFVAPPPSEPASYEAPPEPVYIPVPYAPRPAPAPVWTRRSGPQILYVRKPSKRQGPLVVYGSG